MIVWRLSAKLLTFLLAIGAVVSETAFGQAPDPKGPSAEQRLRYRWEPGQKYRYYFTVTGEVLDSKLTTTALSSITVKAAGQPSGSSANTLSLINSLTNAVAESFSGTGALLYTYKSTVAQSLVLNPSLMRYWNESGPT